MSAVNACHPSQRASATAFPLHGRSLVVLIASLRSYGRRLLLPVVIAALMVSASGVAPAPGAWSTAQLSQGRAMLAATSVGNLAMFAGGAQTTPAYPSSTVDVYDVATGEWSTAQLSVARLGLSATSVRTFALFAGGSLTGDVLADGG